MYLHHRLWSCMSNSILRKGLMFGGYQLSTAIATSTHTPFLRRMPVVSTNNRWLSSSSSGVIMIPKKGFTRIPWLFLSPVDYENVLPVFNPFDRCFYNIPIPKELQGSDNSVRGSGYGWLVMVKSCMAGGDYYRKPTAMILSLYNPITRAHIPLPSVPPEDVVGNPQLWCDPTKASPGQPVLSITWGIRSKQILIYHQGNDCWYKIDTPPGYQVHNTLYHEADAILYITDFSGRLSVLDLATSTLRPLIDTPYQEINSLRGSRRLVVGAAGDLLMVVENWPKYERPQFDVFKLDRRCLKWARTESIGDHTLFVHNHHALSMVCDSTFTDAQANQFYIFKQYRTRYAGNRQGKFTDNKFMTEMPADVQVSDLIAAAANSPGDQKEQLFFKTSNILREGHFWYKDFAAWMVPSLT